MAISLLTVSFRCFVRWRMLKAFGWDDTLMVLAMVLDIVLTACAIAGAKDGVGRHLSNFHSFDEFHHAMLWWWLGQCIYIWASGIAKVSIALALLRLSVHTYQRITLWIVMGASICISLVFWFFMLFQCHPVSKFWERTGPGNCMSTDTLIRVAYVYSGICAVCDFALGLLPIDLVRQLQTTLTTKIALGATLSLGCVASTAVILRIPCLHYYKDIDFLYSTYSIDIWSFIEVGLGITAGSLVTLRPLFRAVLGDPPDHKGKKSRGSMPLTSFTEYTRTRPDPEDDAVWQSPQPDATRNITTTVVSAFRAGLNSPLTPTFAAELKKGRSVRIKRSFHVTEEHVGY
ncbi:cation-transporting ATPase 4 [Aspergillus eucalypticola CBS 122712]|uniref:Cation-transporting ATPase 4 n=1 Tax=Aspergillus eucalypticola (strain CBS 122712 / IBT 29274) TaxID=1448314 RepID=A0A317UJ14_ASPEC|nr:cation-transporting ATPase 4 [Aspergillus eucalypticola CBS 122712]PWY62083.1 cation-transporting ATPase 4 [Aspergillus eucalypticola CBS 122712]